MLRFLAAATLVLVPEPDGDRPKDAPLKSLCAVAKHLEKGMAEYLKGASVTDAFKPWEAAAEKKPELRETLKEAGVASTPSIGFELYISFARKGTLAYRVRTEVHVTPTEALIFSLGGGGSEGGNLRGLAASACKDQAAPFGEAALTFSKAAKTGKPEALPFADPEKVLKLVPEAMRAGFIRDFEGSKKAAAAVVAAIAALDYDEVWIDADDQYTAALGADGAPREGMIRTKFDLKEGGIVAFRLSRFEKP